MQNDVQGKVIQVTILLFSHFRKILNELSSEEVTHIEGKDNRPASTGVAGVTVPTSGLYQTSSGQYSTNSAIDFKMSIEMSLLLNKKFKILTYPSKCLTKSNTILWLF